VSAAMLVGGQETWHPNPDIFYADGAVGYERIVPAAARAGAEWLIVEQDEPVGSELDDARRSLAAVITMLGEVA
ncbi:MAG: hypothetical protein QOE87_346, partial [Gaiellales bacterium]|nr:hypothetical protein [Gaiellales bacterium]